MTPDALVTALVNAEEAEAAFRAAVRQAHLYLGTADEGRAVKIVHKCQRERDRANERAFAVQQQMAVTA